MSFVPIVIFVIEGSLRIL